ncbi:hypothetical protein [Kitasatospora purpeofusca]|uniref:hypothetical protein n=1 Tax=Kitasatospora purpeofusca TaxID=67352 RepID=UPI0035DFAC8E
MYNGGACGLWRGSDVHITDKPYGNKTALTDWFKNLPKGWENPDCAFGTYVSSNCTGFIKGDQVWVTDWDAPELLSSYFPGMPSGWTSGIKSAWLYEGSNALGLWRGNEVHVTDKPAGNTAQITSFFSNLPSGWENADCAYGTYGSGAVGFIKGNEVWVTDWQMPKLLQAHWPGLPTEWAQ